MVRIRVRVMVRISVRVRIRVWVKVGGGRSDVQRHRPQNYMPKANLDVLFRCEASFCRHPSIEM